MPPAPPDPDRWLADHGDVLYAMARRRVASPEAAEDLVQETLLAAVRAADTFRGEAAVQTWLVSILRRKVIDHYRHEAAASRGSGDTAMSLDRFFDGTGVWREPAAPATGWGGDPTAGLDRDELAADLGACVDALPETLRGAFVLREVEGVPADEVCQVLGITPSNLWARMHRARLRMRACLQARGAAPGNDPPLAPPGSPKQHRSP